MTASSTRCCRRFDLLGALIGFMLGLFVAPPAHAQGIEVRKVAVTLYEDAYLLEAQFDISLTHTLEEVLNKGVALYFALDFELIRPRWYWFNDRVAALHQEYRVSYNALTRQYRVGAGPLHQNFGTLAEALELMSRVRRRQEVEPGSLRKDTYQAAIRLRLDTAQLPKPFQLNALGSREWYVGSDWFRWTINP